MSIANPLWGAPRIHGELLKLGIDVGQTSVAKYMVRTRRPPSQGWKAFLRNHANRIFAIDLFVVPTVSFRLLYGLLIMGHSRRQVLWLACVVRAPGSNSSSIALLRMRSDLWVSCDNLQNRSTASIGPACVLNLLE